MADDETGSKLRTYIRSMKQANNIEAQTTALADLMDTRSYQELEHDLIQAYARSNFKLQPLIDDSNFRTSKVQF